MNTDEKLFPLFETFNDIESEISEDDGGKKNYYLKGLYTECEKKNGNGRTYPFALVEREINSRLKPKIESNVAFGEFSHPKTLAEMAEIEPSRISHRIVELRPEGTDFYGKAVLIPEGLGKIAIAMVETGGVLSMSSRGVGRINKNSGMVDESYRLYTFDLVINPGMKKASQTAILENEELFVDEMELFTKDEWKKMEKNRKTLLESLMFRVDLLSMIENLKNLR